MRTYLLRPRVAVLLGLIAVVPLAGCGGGSGNGWPDTSGPRVVVSFPPLYSFAASVVGDEGAVRTVMSGVGPHDFDPKPSDHRLLHGASVFFVNGLALDEKVATLMKNGSGNRGLKVVNLGTAIDPKLLHEGAACVHEDEEGHVHSHEHAIDPHVWLAPELAELQVNSIRDGLKEVSPKYAAGYDRRAAEYVERLRKLKTDGTAMLKDKKDRKFVTVHGALAYFAHSFGLEIADVIQKVPGKEPSGKELEAIAAACVKNGVRVIAVEPQYSSQAAAQRIADELRRKGVPDPVLVEIDPLETANPAELSADWYVTKMQKNLDELAKALR